MFNNIIGQEIAKKILSLQIRNNMLPNAYLFFGPQGVGKTLMAKEFAKEINCGCQKCKICSSIENETNTDFIVISPGRIAKKEISIRDIIEIKERLAYKNIFLKYRIVVIKDADMLTEEASNAFLKILEEPPNYTIFIIITTKPHALLETIRSRCHKIRFRRLKIEEMKELGIPKTISQKAYGNVELAQKMATSEWENLLKETHEFIKSTKIDRIKNSTNIINFELNDFLFAIENFYINLLRKNQSSSYNVRQSLAFKEIIDGINFCEKAFIALKQNVHKQLIIYWLAKVLPTYPDTQ